MTLLLLDGEAIQGKTLKVTANLRIEADDMSGQTSNTEKAHKGFKPKTLTVNLIVPYKNSDWLRALMRLAEATEGGGQLKTYRVVNDTAAAFGMRQVTFAETISAREDDSLACWKIQFGLTEKKSNPEKVEKRSDKSAVTAQSGTGSTVGGSGEGPGEGEGQSGLTGFEATLKKIDDWIGS